MMRCNVCMNSTECEIHTNLKCFACGNAACAACTKVVSEYYRHKRKRICLDCQHEHREGIRMKIRVTNNSELELNDISAVFRHRDGYRVVFKDGSLFNNGSAKQYRSIQLTQQAREAFEAMVET